jgi:protein-S-isoprenylcysteine O-methyltransferase Ste14
MTTAVIGSNKAPVTAWRHARAVLLLPLMNTVVIPSLLLARWPPSIPSFARLGELTVVSAGVVLVLCGAALVAHSIGLFVRIGRGTLAPWDPTQELVTAGAYRYSRNPMKAGLFLVLAGELLLTRSVAIALWFTVFAIVNVLYIRLHEEPALLRRFGSRYRDYCTRVPRWWPALRSLRHTLD